MRAHHGDTLRFDKQNADQSNQAGIEEQQRTSIEELKKALERRFVRGKEPVLSRRLPRQEIRLGDRRRRLGL